MSPKICGPGALLGSCKTSLDTRQAGHSVGDSARRLSCGFATIRGVPPATRGVRSAILAAGIATGLRRTRQQFAERPCAVAGCTRAAIAGRLLGANPKVFTQGTMSELTSAGVDQNRMAAGAEADPWMRAQAGWKSTKRAARRRSSSFFCAGSIQTGCVADVLSNGRWAGNAAIAGATNFASGRATSGLSAT